MLVFLCYIFQVCFVGFAYAAGAGLYFSGDELNQYAEFEAWDFSINGTLSFLFQTEKRDAFLLYHDNKKNGRGQDWMEASIYNGSVRLRMNIGFCGQHSELIVPGDFSDSKWHYVKITLGYTFIFLTVDNKHESLDVVACAPKDKTRKRWALMYIGGIPFYEKFDSNLWSKPTLLQFVGSTRFEGCIGNLMFQKGNSRAFKAKLKRKKHASNSECDNACRPSPQSLPQCRNGGICIDHIVTFDCDCKGTGFQGDYCSTESTMVYMNGTGYIVYKVMTPNFEWSMKNNYVAFRLVPLYHSGVILYLGERKDHLVVELINGKLQVAINLGGGQRVMRSNVSLNISQYHFVEIVRRKQRLTVDINRGWEILTDTTKGNLYSLDLKGKERVAYFGGGPGPDALPLSTCKRNFSGFLQQFKFDKFRVLDKVMPSSHDKKRFNVHGWILEGSLKRDLLPNNAEIGGSGCGNPDDDDDLDRCPPPTTRCFTPECIFRSITTETEFTTAPSTAALPATVERETPTDGMVLSLRESRGPNHNVSPWIIIIIVAVAVVAVLITIFFLYRWNNRYSGSFKPSKGEPGEGVQPLERGYEQPAFYVSPNKPTKAEESMA